MAEHHRLGHRTRPTRSPRWRATTALLAAFALLASACGGEDPDDAPDDLDDEVTDEDEVDDTDAAGEPDEDEDVEEEVDAAADECDPADVNLNVTYPGRLGPTLPGAAEALQEQYPDLEIELSDSATTYTDNLQQVVADESAGMVPDVVMAGTGQVAFYVDALEARELGEDVVPDTYNRDYLIAGEVDGALHAVPIQVSMPIMVWNQEIFDAAGLDPDTAPETYSEVLEFAETIEAEVPDVSPAFYPSTIVYDWFFQNMLLSAGGEMTDDAGDPAFASPEGVTALEPWVELNARDLQAPASGLEGIEIFAAGEIGMVLGTNAVLAQMDAGIGDRFEWGVAPAPVADDGERRFTAGGNALMILAEDPCEQRFAEEFIATALEPGAQAMVAEETGYIPVDTQAVEMLEDFYAENPQYAVPVEYDGDLEAWISFRGERSFEASEEFRTLLESVAAGADPAEALEEAEASVSGILGSGG